MEDSHPSRFSSRGSSHKVSYENAKHTGEVLMKRWVKGHLLLLLTMLTSIIVFTKSPSKNPNEQSEIWLAAWQTRQFPARFFQKTDFEHESTDLIANVLYQSLPGLYKSMAPSGANGANIHWQGNQAENWYIEGQRYGEELVIGGLIKNDPKAIEAGFKMFDWGFAHQAEDGSFLLTGDSFHSTSFFVQAVAHTLLVIQQSPQSEKYAKEVAHYTPLVHRAAQWMISPAVWEKGITHNKPYTHRRYLVATALGLTGKLTDDPELINYARQSIEDGLSLQQKDGVNPEKGGYDTSYQMVGVVYAQRWVIYFPKDSLTPRVKAMIDKALSWEKTKILPSGEISSEGNTRTAGQETGRSRKVKKVDFKSAIRGFAYWASVTGDKKWEAIARRVAQYYHNVALKS
ncbi:hypothetical protein [Mastigocladopsis repens]|uniref:hypothetical protein n=1 Tax=Mastigocladopsis repens TaxID=221287 RepID=UPI00036E8D55|nr:hypothetical protein [Mastigocladopsis repens]